MGEFSGELACLLAAGMWAVAVAIFRRPIQQFGAPAVNLVKSVIATLLLGLTVLATGQGGALTGAGAGPLGLIAASGLVGLTLGDTALFAAVGRIGPYRTMLLQTLAPVFTALFAVIWLGTIPTGREILGACVILAGVLMVITPARGSVPQPAVAGMSLKAGYLFGVLSALGQGVGIVLAKDGMETIPFVPATFFRLVVAAAGLMILTAASGRFRRVLQAVRDGRSLGRMAGASFLGTYLAMMCMMAGVWLAPPAVSATLLSTTPVFSLFIDANSNRERIAPRKILGTVIAILGVALLAGIGAA
jgi:drug/metabolite transporter (DMT)-like permease